MRKRTLKISHRGFADSSCPENSLVAFQKAVEKGYDMIELDIREVKGEPIISHDVPEETKDLVTFETLLKTLPKEVGLIVNIKEESLDEEYLEKFLHLVREYSWFGKVVILSKKPLAYFENTIPISISLQDNIQEFSKNDVVFAFPEELTDETLSELRGRKVFTSVIRNRIERLYPSENHFKIAKKQINNLKGKVDGLIIDSSYHSLILALNQT